MIVKFWRVKLVNGTSSRKHQREMGELTDDDLTEINGKRDQLLGKLQKKYGYAKDKAEQELAEWKKNSGNQE